MYCDQKMFLFKIRLRSQSSNGNSLLGECKRDGDSRQVSALPTERWWFVVIDIFDLKTPAK